MNVIEKLQDTKNALSLYFFEEVHHHIDNAMSTYRKSLKDLSYSQNTIKLVIDFANELSSPEFDIMIRYMLNANNHIDRRLYIQSEVKRLIRKKDKLDIKKIVTGHIYQQRFCYVFYKKVNI